MVIVGASGHAKVVADVVETHGLHQIVGFLDDGKEIGAAVAGYSVIGKSADLPHLPSIEGVIVAIGDNAIRAKVVSKIKDIAPHVQFVSAVHPKAAVSKHSTIGPGTVVMAGAVVNPSCVIGGHCIVNTGATIDHDSSMSDFSSLAPGVVTGGKCRIGKFSAISIGAILKHGVTIGDDTVIGASALILKDVPSNTVCYGTPGRAIRERNHGDRYL